jgi:Ran GTPase-activating protein (RanGAP) involved in mRNA processing and transport
MLFSAYAVTVSDGLLSRWSPDADYVEEEMDRDRAQIIALLAVFAEAASESRLDLWGYPMTPADCGILAKLFADELRDADVSPESCVAVVRGLASVRLVAQVDLRDNRRLKFEEAANLGHMFLDAGARPGGATIKEVSTIPLRSLVDGLLDLDLRKQGLGDFEAGLLATVLPATQLQVLDVRDNRFSPDAARVLEPPVQKKLKHCCDIPVAALRAERLERLDLTARGFAEFEAVLLARLLASNKSLKNLDMRANPALGEEASKAFIKLLSGPNATLEVLSDMPIKEVRENGVRELDLSNRDPSLADFEVRVVADLLKTNRSVHDLDLRGNKMGKHGVAALQAMCLKNAQIELLCGLQIRKFVQSNDLTNLDMSAMKLGHAELLILIDFLRTQERLKKLDLRRNGALTAASVESVLTLVLPTVGPDEISEVPVRKDEDREELDLRGKRLGTFEVHLLKRMLPEFPNLRALNLQQNIFSYFVDAPAKGERAPEETDGFWRVSEFDLARRPEVLGCRIDLAVSEVKTNDAKGIADDLLAAALKHPRLGRDSSATLNSVPLNFAGLTTLDLRGRGLADFELYLLSKALPTSGVTSCDLRENDCSTEGAGILADAVQARSKHGPIVISTIPCPQFLDKSLHEWSGRAAGLGFLEVSLLAKLLPLSRVERLDLRDNPALDASAAAVLAPLLHNEDIALATISELRLRSFLTGKFQGNPNIELAGLADFELALLSCVLKDATTVATLTLPKPHCSLRGLRAVGLALAETQSGYRATSAAGQHRQELESLQLACKFPIGQLRANRIETLDLRRQRIGQQEAVVLFALLERNVSVHEVLFNAMSFNLVNTNPKTQNPPTRSPVVMECATVLRRAAVDLLFEDDGSWRLSSLEKFNLVKLKELRGDTGAELSGVELPGAALERQKTTLLRLDLSHEGLGDLDAVVLFAVLEKVHVKRVDLQGNKLSGVAANAAVAAVRANPELENISGVPAQDLLADTISEVNLVAANVGDFELMVLAELLRGDPPTIPRPSVKTCDLRQNPSVTFVGAFALFEVLSLEDSPLELVSGMPIRKLLIGEARTQLVSGTPQLDGESSAGGDPSDQADDAGEGAAADAEAQEDQGETIDLSNQRLGDLEAFLLYLVVRASEDLQSLDLRGNPITPVAAAALQDVFQSHKNIRAVSGIPLRDVRVNGVSVLDLRAQKLGDFEALLLAAMIEDPDSAGLRHLDLRSNCFSPAVAGNIAVALKARGQLVTLSAMPVGDVRRNKQTRLDLDHMDLGDFELAVLTALLRENHSVTSVSLSGNNFTTVGYNIFMDMVRSGENLKHAGELNLFSLQQLARGHVSEFEVVGKDVGDFEIALLVQCMVESSVDRIAIRRCRLAEDLIPAVVASLARGLQDARVQLFNAIPIAQWKAGQLRELNLLDQPGCFGEKPTSFEALLLVELFAAFPAEEPLEEIFFDTTDLGETAIQALVRLIRPELDPSSLAGRPASPAENQGLSHVGRMPVARLLDNELSAYYVRPEPEVAAEKAATQKAPAENAAAAEKAAAEKAADEKAAAEKADFEDGIFREAAVASSFDVALLTELLPRNMSLRHIDLHVETLVSDSVLDALREAVIGHVTLEEFCRIPTKELRGLEDGTVRTVDWSAQRISDFVMRFCLPLLEHAEDVNIHGCTLAGATAELVLAWVLRGSVQRLTGIPTAAVLRGEFGGADALAVAGEGLGEFECFVLASLLQQAAVRSLQVELHLDGGYGSARFREMLAETQTLETVNRLPVRALADDTLTDLPLDDAVLGDLDALILADLLEKSQNLRKLTLGMGTSSDAFTQMWHGAVVIFGAVEKSSNMDLEVSLLGQQVRKEQCKQMREIMEDPKATADQLAGSPLARLCSIPMKQMEDPEFPDLEVDIRGRGLTDFEVKIFSNLLVKNNYRPGGPSVRSVDMRDNPEISDEALELLLQAVRGHKRCSILSAIPIRALAAGNLRQLDLQNRGLGDPEAFLLCRALTPEARVQRLDLRGNAFGPGAAKRIVDCVHKADIETVSDIPVRDLRLNRRTDLSLQNANLGDFEACVLASSLRQNESLSMLNVEGNLFADEQIADELADALLAHKKIEVYNKFPVLDLKRGKEKRIVLNRSTPPLVDFDIAILARLLDGSQVQHLDLSENQIGMAGFRRLARALGSLQLQYLAIQGNGSMSSRAYVDLLEVLERSQLARDSSVNLWGQRVRETQLGSLRRLLLNKLYGTVIGPDLDAIIQALDYVDVHEMNLQGCVLQKRDAQKLLTAIIAKSKFKLHLWGLPLTPEDCVIAREILESTDGEEIDTELTIRLAANIGSRHGHTLNRAMTMAKLSSKVIKGNAY